MAEPPDDHDSVAFARTAVAARAADATIGETAETYAPAPSAPDAEGTPRPVAISSDDTAGTIDLAGSTLDASSTFEARYQLRRLLGAGGMGEVRLAKDRRVGREVALKVLRGRSAHDPASRVRFVREARVQGQLEHPAVVPVYDLGTGPDGTVYFTMKRVRGMTLAEVLQGLAAHEPQVTARYSRRKLLTAFATVCLALDFAHTHGVLHRDLKPSNVMLGDYGEVHLLDWGLARVIGASDGVASSEPEASPDVGAPERGTLQGALLGTPGYMSPEQTRGETTTLDARSDVYALGVILFEILALTPLHQADTVHGLLVAPLQSCDARPSARVLDAEIAPELDAICVRATALDPGDRYASAREMCDAIERYLDGDRDLQHRREMAAAHVDAARAALTETAVPGAGGREARARAMREVTRALALDPGDPHAATLLASLFVNAPDDLPPEAEIELEESAVRNREMAARVSAMRYLTWLAFAPLFYGLGVRTGLAAWAPFVMIVASAGIAWWMSRPGRARLGVGLLLLLCSGAACSLLSGVFSPFILVPALVGTNTIFFALQVQRRHRQVVAVVGVAALLLPVLLEWIGLLPPSVAFADGHLTLLPRVTWFPPATTYAVLVLTSIAMVITPAVLAGRVRDALDRAERRLFLHAWHLRQMLPDEARSNVVSTEPRHPSSRDVTSTQGVTHEGPGAKR